MLPDWLRFFDGRQRAYCGVTDGQVVSFCLIEDMGVYTIGGRPYRIGGPGCVGTVPAYRDRGIGLNMVKNVTQILRDEGYDYSYIHYTGVAPWYRKLGYRTILRWNGRGVVPEYAGEAGKCV